MNLKTRTILSALLLAFLLAVVVNFVLGRGQPNHASAYLTRDDPAVGVEELGPRAWRVIDIHEHLKGDDEAQRLIPAMDQFGITRTCLMASSLYTLTLNPVYGFEGYKENNEAILAVKKKWPGRFCAFVTLNPLDDGNVALLKDYVARGADGQVIDGLTFYVKVDT